MPKGLRHILDGGRVVEWRELLDTFTIKIIRVYLGPSSPRIVGYLYSTLDESMQPLSLTLEEITLTIEEAVICSR